MGMYKVCTEAARFLELQTRTLSQVWACVKDVMKCPSMPVMWEKRCERPHHIMIHLAESTPHR